MKDIVRCQSVRSGQNLNRWLTVLDDNQSRLYTGLTVVFGVSGINNHVHKHLQRFKDCFRLGKYIPKLHEWLTAYSTTKGYPQQQYIYKNSRNIIYHMMSCSIADSRAALEGIQAHISVNWRYKTHVHTHLLYKTHIHTHILYVYASQNLIVTKNHMLQVLV